MSRVVKGGEKGGGSEGVLLPPFCWVLISSPMNSLWAPQQGRRGSRGGRKRKFSLIGGGFVVSGLRLL